LFYIKLVGVPGFAWDFIVSSVSMSLCFYVSLYCISVSPSISPKPNLTLNMPTGPLSLSPHTFLCPYKKFPVVEAHFWLEELFIL